MASYQPHPDPLKKSGNPGHGGYDSLFSSDDTMLGWGEPGLAHHQPQVLDINAFADSTVTIGAQGSRPADYVSLSISLDNVINLAGFANSGASGTVTSAATDQGMLTITNGVLRGAYTASMSIDLTAYVAAAHATVRMTVTDQFQLSLSGTGFTSATLADGVAAGGTVETAAPADNAHGQADGKGGATFDLASFAASVLNTAQWNIAFMAGAGESLQAVGTSVLTINAIASIAGGPRPEVSYFREADRSSLSFDEGSPATKGSSFVSQPPTPPPGQMFHGL